MESLGKPPIIEAWIGLRFEPNPDRSPWTGEAARVFFSQYSEQFPDAEFEAERRVSLQGGSLRELPQVVGQETAIRKVQVYNQDRSRCIQWTEDKLIYNVAEAGSSYPGFSQLCDEAMDKFRDFIQRFEPLQIRDAVIAYIDVIEIPLKNGRIERLEDFFKFAPDPPEKPFGLMTAFSYRNVFDCPVDPGPLIVNVTPLSTDAGIGRFHMDWQKISEDVNTLDLSIVKKRLDRSHEYMRDCFRESLTEEAWRLFDPRGQD